LNIEFFFFEGIEYWMFESWNRAVKLQD